MSIDSNKIFFSPEIASSIGLEEAIILNFIESNSPGLNEKNLVIKLSFIPNKDIDKALTKLRRGGHDSTKLFAAYKEATEHKGQPSVVLAKTVKGWALGKGFEARNMTHQKKALEKSDWEYFRDLLERGYTWVSVDGNNRSIAVINFINMRPIYCT